MYIIGYVSGVGRILILGRIEEPRGRGAEGAQGGGVRAPRRWGGVGEGAVPPPQKIFDYFI